MTDAMAGINYMWGSCRCLRLQVVFKFWKTSRRLRISASARSSGTTIAWTTRELAKKRGRSTAPEV